MKSIAILFCLLGVSTARMAYQFSDGYLDVLRNEPQEVFTCEGRPYGYYADVDNACKVFHICVPHRDANEEVVRTDQFSFICPNGTDFDQSSLVCVHEGQSVCEEATALYEISNGEFGKIPDGNENSDRGVGRSLNDQNDSLNKISPSNEKTEDDLEIIDYDYGVNNRANNPDLNFDYGIALDDVTSASV